MKAYALRVLTMLVVLAGASTGLAQDVDLLRGTAGDTVLCSLDPATTVELFGIPSRAHVEDEHAVIEYAHRGFALRFDGEDVAAPLAMVRLYPVDRDGFMGYRGHFLGTVASGTARGPVVRIVRSARAEIIADEADVLQARMDDFELQIEFLYGMIDIVELTCLAEGEPAG